MRLRSSRKSHRGWDLDRHPATRTPPISVEAAKFTALPSKLELYASVICRRPSGLRTDEGLGAWFPCAERRLSRSQVIIRSSSGKQRAVLVLETMIERLNCA